MQNEEVFDEAEFDELMGELDALDNELAEEEQEVVEPEPEKTEEKPKPKRTRKKKEPESEASVDPVESTPAQASEPEKVEQVEQPMAEPIEDFDPDSEDELNMTVLRKALSFSEADLSNAFASQATSFVRYAAIAHRLALAADQAKNKVAIMEARVDTELRKEAAEEGRKVTESQLNKQVALDSRYIKLVQEATDAKAKAALAKDVLEAFRQRRDMLIQVGADLREEAKGELFMRQRNQGSQDARDKVEDFKRQLGNKTG